MKGIWVAALVCLSAPIGANAAGGNFWAAGAGTTSCGATVKYLDGFGGPEQIRQWVWGYISAYNRYNSVGKGVQFSDGEAITAFIRKRCTEYPLETLMQATTVLIANLPAE